MDAWPHQTRTANDVESRIQAGIRRLAVTVPTGGGKTYIMGLLARQWLAQGLRVGIYTNRRMLLEQLSRVMLDYGLDHGVIASGEDDERERKLQVLSIQTEHSQKKRQGLRWIPDRALVDEGHLQTGEMAQAIYKEIIDQGGAYVLFTGTPLGLAEVCDDLIIGATMTELRECGAIVPAVHYGPDEPDWRDFKACKPGMVTTEQQAQKAMAPARVFGSVWEWFNKLNPERRPTFLFGPGVPEAKWYAERFFKEGVTAAHIDGEEIWINGELQQANEENRGRLLWLQKQGRVCVICNRFVLREGIDAPWVSHLVFATVYGSLGSYLQSGGRLLRAYRDLATVTVQDHGGNWWRHGSLNEDRAWELTLDADSFSGMRAHRLRNKADKEPFRCPKCGRIWGAGRLCNPARGGCGYVVTWKRPARPVLTASGELREMTGDIFRKRTISKDARGPKIWERFYWAAYKWPAGRTFAAAEVLFAYNHKWSWPDPTWPLMPTFERDRFRLVRDVPFYRLTSMPERAHEKGLFDGQESQTEKAEADDFLRGS